MPLHRSCHCRMCPSPSGVSCIPFDCFCVHLHPVASVIALIYRSRTSAYCFRRRPTRTRQRKLHRWFDFHSLLHAIVYLPTFCLLSSCLYCQHYIPYPALPPFDDISILSIGVSGLLIDFITSQHSLSPCHIYLVQPRTSQ